ncbi:transcription-repair coupling factor [Clostridium sediminicola]|uniref:transcription-repair coupling factor n=1 Tax=Clostridium sediminicola TaxID=3114879 RepID=UPI0031F21F27
MRLKGLIDPLLNSNDFINIMDDIREKRLPLEINGLSDSGKAYLIYSLFHKSDKSTFIITSSDVEAKNMYEDLSFYYPSVYFLPSKPVVFYNVYAVSGDLRWERLKVIKEILNNKKKIIITSIESMMAACVSPELYKKNTVKISLGDVINVDELVQILIDSGYRRVNMIDSKGQFSIRGGIIDIYSPVEALPYRIELFDDEVDSIRNFNIESQRSIEKVNNIEIFPAKELILTDNEIAKGAERIQKDFDHLIQKLSDDEDIDKTSKSINRNLELLKEHRTFDTIESYLPYFYDNTYTLFDYMKDFIVILDDEVRTLNRANSVFFEFQDDYKNYLQRGNVLPKQAELISDKESFYSYLQNTNLVAFNPIAKSSSQNELMKRRHLRFEQITLSGYQGKMDLLIEDIKRMQSKNYKTIILSGTRPRGERLASSLREEGLNCVYKDKIEKIDSGKVVITFGNQQKGFQYPDLNICVISDKDIFGKSRKKSKRIKGKGISKISSYTDLKPGDYVVHTNHGIGVFKGIKQLDVQDCKKDYLELKYNSGDKLYVPVDQLDLVQKYVGSEGKQPKVNKLGGNEWSKSKKKVRRAINEIAEDLVKLYAIRSTLKGHKYNKDTVWQKQFEEEFPFQETPDQLQAIEEIKDDMESNKVMDRLLCGDVGYGKTEVALRAAFKAVMEGKQVAILVPTTILAEQHYNNIIKRFSDFPVKIDMISRFRTPTQQKKTLLEVKAGNVDVLIGTHRILQKDVQFKELGLLVVDEEQRFGVTHKEKIKNLKKNIEVLTLTATPIPRTLHMSLTGIRDISVIETPPEERYPVQTYVVEFNEQLISDAILRELDRDGQVYFVYNRVETIKEMAVYLNNLVPDARIAVAHGQMKERELEKVMLDFMDKKYDILLCTTIIETGLDIQNANTMIIYDADKFGLSQLYQLRGRVGRTNRIAYAYLTYKPDKILSEVAEKRLKAIKDFTELGSGFKIAMRDLEIRGSGNVIGNSQHGQMASVGYDLYCRMLENTIKMLKGEIEKEPIETTVDLKIDAFIPERYISDEMQKIEVYKRIASIDSEESLMDIQEELEDRFSDIPDSVDNLMKIALLRSIANSLGIEEVKEKNNEVIIKFENNNHFSGEFINGILQEYSNYIVFSLGDKPIINFELKEVKKEFLVNILKEFFEHLKSLIETK